MKEIVNIFLLVALILGIFYFASFIVASVPWYAYAGFTICFCFYWLIRFFSFIIRVRNDYRKSKNRAKIIEDGIQSKIRARYGTGSPFLDNIPHSQKAKPN